MQLKLNFLCKDSVLAAPLVVEIARVLDLAAQRGEGGVQEQMGLFFKAPADHWAAKRSTGSASSRRRSTAGSTASERRHARR